jgi:CelD/BcsL family acetyltransferase involved in cellulose biosynthesis
MTTVIVRDAATFAAMRDEWNALLADSDADTVFLSWEWLHTWWQHLGGRGTLAVVTVRTDGRLDAVAPLTMEQGSFPRRWPCATLESIGSGLVGSDHLDVIVRRGRETLALPALATALNRLGGVVRIPRFRPGAFADALGAHLENRGWETDAPVTESAPYITLAAHTWESYLAALGPEHRANVRRRIRKLEASFAVRFEAAATEGERREALDTLIDLHQRRWEGRGGSSAFTSPAYVAFHHAFTALALERGWLRLFVLRLDGQPVAALYGLRHGRTLSFYQSGFDPAAAKHSVGLVTMGLAIRAAIAEGAGEFDMLHGEEPYKSLWAFQRRELRTLTMYPASAAGSISRRIDALARAAKHAARRVVGRAACL